VDERSIRGTVAGRHPVEDAHPEHQTETGDCDSEIFQDGTAGSRQQRSRLHGSNSLPGNGWIANFLSGGNPKESIH
jgi:hypothetical protein